MSVSPGPPSSPASGSVPSLRRVPSAARLQHLGDRFFGGLCLVMALAVPLIVLLMLVLLVVQSWSAIRAFGPRFLVDTDWDTRAQHFGALPYIYGTLVTSALAMLLAVPLGVGAAAYLAEIASGWVRRVG